MFLLEDDDVGSSVDGSGSGRGTRTLVFTDKFTEDVTGAAVSLEEGTFMLIETGEVIGEGEYIGFEDKMFVLTSKFTVESEMGGSIGAGDLKLGDIGDVTGEDVELDAGWESEGD